MNEIVKLMVAVIGIFSLMGSTVFYLNMMFYSVRISQGDYNATQDMAEDVAEEVKDTVVWSAVICVAIAFAGALGLGGVVASLKKP